MFKKKKKEKEKQKNVNVYLMESSLLNLLEEKLCKLIVATKCFILCS